jgi:hypothetical protein
MDRLTWTIVGGVLSLVAAGLILASVARDQAPPPDLSTPSGVVVAYALAEQRGDGSAAWNLLASTAQARGDRDHFVAGASGRADERASLTTENERVDGDSATVVVVRTETASRGLLGSGSSSYRNTVALVREDGHWRISVPPDEYLLFRVRGAQP